MEDDKRILLLKATGEQVLSKNPLLMNGEILNEYTYIEGQLAYVRTKVGDGVSDYADLPYVAGDIYTDTNPATATIGGILKDSTWDGKRAIDMLKALISPYQAPSVPSLTHNVSGTAKSSHIYEIGRAITGSFNMAWTKTNINNFNAGNVAYFESSAAIFNNGLDLFDAKSNSVKTLTLTESYAPSTLTTVSLILKFRDINNVLYSSPAATISWHTTMYYGTSDQSKLTTSAQVNALNKKLTNARAGDFSYPGAGYNYLCIPQVISQTNIRFTDPATNLVYPFTLQNVEDNTAPATIVVTNAEGLAVTCNIYRSVNSINDPSTVRVS